jgi:hypothetical protein
MTRTASAHGLTSEPAGKWAKQAACRGVDPDVMHPSNDETEIQRAKKVCAGCWVARECFWDAVATGDMEHGIRAGLRPNERRAVLKEINRRKAPPAEPATEQKTTPVEAPAAPRRKPYTDLRSLFDDNTKRLINGHLAWTGTAKPSFEGRSYNPKQVAFILDRGRTPVGRVLTTCSLSGCVLAAHIADDEERARCGTRLGYRRHLANGETPCAPCRQANTDADNRLRRTGTTKVAA